MHTGTPRPSPVATVGLIAGSIALLLAVIHFWGGPFDEPANLEEAVARTASHLRESMLAALRGEEAAASASSRIDLDHLVRTSAAVLAALALILACIGYAREESRKVAVGAAALGLVTLTLQFAIVALGGLLAAVLIGYAISRIDLGCCCCE